MTVLNSLSKRERYIAIGVIAAVGIFVLNQFLLTPYTDARAAMRADRDRVDTQLADAERLMAKQKALAPIWADIQKNGLKTDRGRAESQAQQAVLDWAKSAGVNVASVKPERDQQQNQFQIIGFHVTGNGTMLSLSKLLYSIETAKIPVRLNDLQIAPRKEGTDDLTMQISVSTLALMPEPAKPAGGVSTVSNDGSATR